MFLLSAKSQRRPTQPRRSAVLRLEALENRLAPAVFLVTDLSDAAGSATDVTLRYAVAHLDTGTAATTNTINFASNLAGQTFTESAANGELSINQGVTITAPTGGLTIDGGGASGAQGDVLFVGASIVLNGLTITHADNVGSDGGGVFNSGTLTINNCTFSANFGKAGGAIANVGTLTVNASTFSGNSSKGAGGAIENFSSSNGTTTSLGSVTVNNSTFFGNTAGTLGGGIDSTGTLTVSDSTFSGNTAGSAGGAGVAFSGGTATLNGNILVGNTSAGQADDINGGGNLAAGSANNVVGVDATMSLSGTTNLLNVTPAQVALAPLADNGGPTLTMALLPGSVAIGIGQTGVDPIDQRGEPRPTTARADAGAFQTQHIFTGVPSTPTVAPPPSVSVAFGPFGEVVELVNSQGVLTQFSAAGAQVLGGGVRSASIAFGPGGGVLEIVGVDGALTQFDATGVHQLSGGGVQSASVAFGPFGEVLEIVNTAGALTQFDASGAHQLGNGGVSSASVAFGPFGEVLEIVNTAGVLTQFSAAGAQQLGGAGVQSAGVAFSGNSLVLDIIFSDGSLDQFDAFGVHQLGKVS
jgi:hypothetical protein